MPSMSSESFKGDFRRVFPLVTWVAVLRRLLFALGATTAFASTAGALSVTLATTSVIGAGSVHPSGEPINVAIGDRIRYALIASSPTGESISVLVTTIFYDPAPLTLISSSGDMRPFLKGPGFVSTGMGLVSAPGLKEGVPGELVAVARASQGGGDRSRPRSRRNPRIRSPRRLESNQRRPGIRRRRPTLLVRGPPPIPIGSGANWRSSDRRPRTSRTAIAPPPEKAPPTTTRAARVR
jgi:hypothetical protein